MTPEERQTLQNIGQAVLGNVITIQSTVCLCYGILAPIPLLVAYSFFKRWSQSWLTKLQFIIAFLSIMIFSGSMALRTAVAIYECKLLGFISLSENKNNFNAFAAKANVVNNWFEYIPPIINDSFIIWRAWVVFQKRLWAWYISLGLCFSTLVITLVILALYSNPTVLMTAESSNNETLFWLLQAATISSLITNLVATLFISWTLWSHMKFLQRITNEKLYQSFEVRRILYLLVDSGAVYAFLQLLEVVMSGVIQPDMYAATIAAYVVGNIYFSISMIYPILTIFLIRSPFSVADVYRTVEPLQISSLV